MSYVLSIALVLLPTVSPGTMTPLDLQPQRSMVQPTPLSADDPRAQRAAAIVNAILAGERERVMEMLKAEGTPALAESADLGSMVDTQIARLANKGYTITDFLTGRGADVLVEMMGRGPEPANLVIRFTPEAPHRIEGFAVATMGGPSR